MTNPTSAMASMFQRKWVVQSGGKLPPAQNTGCGCWVRHHLMEKITMGTSMKAKIEKSHVFFAIVRIT